MFIFVFSSYNALAKENICFGRGRTAIESRRTAVWKGRAAASLDPLYFRRSLAQGGQEHGIKRKLCVLLRIGTFVEYHPEKRRFATESR